MKRRLLLIAALSSGCIPFEELERDYRCDKGYAGCPTVEPAADGGGTDAGEVDAGASDGGVTDGGLGCIAPSADCGTGSCVNLNVSANHCGACGRSCLGGGCLGGACQPVLLQTLIPPVNAFRASIAASSGKIAFNLPDCRVGVAGAAPGSNATFFNQPNCNNPDLVTRVVMEGEQIWWTSDRHLGRIHADGGGFAEVDTNTGSVNRSDLTLSGNLLFYARRGTAEIVSTASNMSSGAAGTSTVGYAATGELQAIAATSSALFFSNRVYGTLFRFPLPLVGQPSLAARPGLVNQLAVCGGALYAAAEHADGGLLLVDPSDGGMKRVGDLVIPASAVACDSSSVYWSTLTPTGGSELYGAPLDGGAAVQLASGSYGVKGVAVDDCCVYWYGTTQSADAGVIHRIRKL